MTSPVHQGITIPEICSAVGATVAFTAFAIGLFYARNALMHISPPTLAEISKTIAIVTGTAITLAVISQLHTQQHRTT